METPLVRAACCSQDLSCGFKPRTVIVLVITHPRVPSRERYRWRTVLSNRIVRRVSAARDSRSLTELARLVAENS